MAVLNSKSHNSKNNREIIIRSATKEDAAHTLNIKKTSIDEEIYEMLSPEEFTKTVLDEEKWIQDTADNPYHIAIVAILDNKIIGLINFHNGHRKRIAHTGQFGMSVDKNVRGLGIGTLLLQSLIDWAKSTQKIEKIDLSVHSNNDRALGLYKKLGFVIEGARKNDLKYGPDNYVDTVIMGKIL